MVSFLPVSPPAPAAAPVQVLFSALVDDAGLFPPEELDMASAVVRHRGDSAQDSPVLSHRFVVPAARLPELQSQLTAADRFAVSIITAAESAAVDRVTDLVAADDRLELVGVETPLSTDWVSGSAIEQALRRLPAGVPVFVEVPTGNDTERALDLLAEQRWSAKIRCGGIRPELFPTTTRLAATIGLCVAWDVPFKATAGLHHAVRYLDPATGFTHHGFLNILVAVARAVRGAGELAVIAALESVDAAALVAEAVDLDTPTAARVRALFVSYGSCSTSDPITDLTALKLIAS